MIEHPSAPVHCGDQCLSDQLLDRFLGTRNRPTVLRRLRWIEDRLWWHRSLRRSDLIERFGISPQQASQDLSSYQQLHPGLAKLDPSSKAYVRENSAKPLFPKEPFSWIAQEMSEKAPVLPMERIPLPGRRADPGIMAALLGAYSARRPLTIEYQSMSRDELSSRTICPHHLVDASHRCHVRAWDALRGRFADFVVGRIVSAKHSPNYPWVDGIADEHWHNQVAMIVTPAPELAPAQRRAVETDYGMCDGQVGFRVRKALITYVAEALGVLEQIRAAPEVGGGRELHCVNAADLAAYVPR